ncbi:MAG TPA: guanylate kinase [Candidatus Saccharimonadia bacterium]
MPTFKPGVTAIVGPSGVGKNTVIAGLIQRYPQLHIGSSLTTRPARQNDLPGRYIHVSKDEFMSRDAAGELLEWAEYASHYYGSILPDKKDVNLILEIEYQGAAQVRLKVPGARIVFMKPPGGTIEEQLAVLEERLAGRSTDTESARNERLVTARRELEIGPTLADLVVVNEDVETTVDEIAAVMYTHLES